jgi:signal transduction histidine kinase/ActR/RegA family two-component response regulator/HAMP domain-containing protein
VNRLRDISIKRKLTLLIMAGSTIALLLVSSGFIAYELFTYQETMTQDLATLAGVIGDRSTAALTFEDKTDATESLRALAARTHITGAAFYDKQGNLFAEYRPRKSVIQFPQSPDREGTRFRSDRLRLFQAIRHKGEKVGTIFIESDLQEMHDRVDQYVRIVFLMALATLLITYFLSMLLQRIISRPIFDLARTAKEVSLEKNYTVRATKRSNDELGQLIDGFNEMLSQIQKRDGALQESHDSLEQRVWERTRDLRTEVAERERAEASLKQQFARISLLNQITQAISERQDTDSILHVVLRQLEDHLSLDVGSIALYDEKADTLNIAALRVKNPMLYPKLNLHEGGVLAVADTRLDLCKNGQTVYLPDTLKQSGLLNEKLASAGLRSLVAVPLMVEGKLFGVLLAARLEPDRFVSGDCEFLRMLSEHVALAAHQARLHHELACAYNDLRRSQETVMQQERLKALGQMASGIAHDVNNALSPIVGFTELMIKMEPNLSTNGKRYLKHIRTAGEDIAHIVARLREFYRRRDDHESLQELNLNTLAEQVIDMTRPRWRDIPQSNGLTVEMQSELAPAVPDLVGIESEVREALTNLVINAVDALPNGGRITLRTRVLAAAPNAEAALERVVVEVTDNGTGMDEETRRRCLEPFFSTKGKRGTGLGLAMVYGVMERHEGSIEIDSEKGKGTTFRLTFPVRKNVSATGDGHDDSTALKPLQILCIDDEPLLRDLLKEMLERDGHAVEVSDGGQSGIEAFRSASRRGKPFDVVITDLGMPYVDGRQVAKTLKRESPQTPVVMLTGWGAFMKEDGGGPTQVDCLLSKPPRSKELRATLSRLHSARAGTAA